MKRAGVKRMNLTTYTTTHNFIFPSLEVLKRKKTEEENVICLPQVHDMLWICTNNMKSYPLHLNLPEFEVADEKGRTEENEFEQPIPPPAISFSRVLRWEKEKGRGRKCNLPAAGAWHVVNLHNNMKSYPLFLNLPEFGGRQWKGQNWREWIWQPIPPPTISFSRVLSWEKETTEEENVICLPQVHDML